MSKKLITGSGDDMKSFLYIVEGKDPKTNRQTVAEQMVTSQYSNNTVPKKKAPSIISKYVEAINEEIQAEVTKKYAKAKDLAKKVTAKMIGEAAPVNGFEKEDKVDTITVDVPLMLRLLEYAKEDAKTDMDLHDVADRLIELSKMHTPLTMDHYNELVSSTVEESSQEKYVLYLNGKPASTYSDEYDAKRDIDHIRKTSPSTKIVLKKEICSQDIVSEVSNELLSKYKKAASADASKADAEGNFERGNKRFSGIVKATKKQFANDIKKHKKSP